MAVSDDVASLKLEIHKLAVAIEELAIKRYSQGEIHKSKLPWFTPQYVPGDSIKLSGSRLPTATAYLDNNEVIASPIASFPHVSDYSIGAHQVLDEISKPSPYENKKLQANVHVTGQQIGFNYTKDDQMSNAYQVFETMPELGVQAEANRSLFSIGVTSKEDNQSVQKMFDELPLPTFIKEMAEAAKTAELDAFEGDYEPASDVAHDLDKKSVQLSSCVVQVWRSRIRLKTSFSYLRNFNGQQYSTEVHRHRDNLLAWNSYLERKHPHMPSEPFYVLDAMHFSKRRLLLHDSDLVMTLVLPMVLGVQACNTRVFESKIGWRAFLTFKELYSWGIHSSCWDCSLLDSSLGKLNSETRATNLIGYLMWPFLNDIELTLNSRLSTIFDVFSAMVYQLENDWRLILNFKEVHSWGNFVLSYECAILVLMSRSYFEDFVTRELMMLLSKCWYILDSHSWLHYVMLKNSVRDAIIKHVVDIDTS